VASILPVALPAHVTSGPRPSVRRLGAHSGAIVRRFRSGGKSGRLEPDSADGLDRNGRIPRSGFSGRFAPVLPPWPSSIKTILTPAASRASGDSLCTPTAATGTGLHLARLHHRANVHVLTRRHSPAPVVSTHSGSSLERGGCFVYSLNCVAQSSLALTPHVPPIARGGRVVELPGERASDQTAQAAG